MLEARFLFLGVRMILCLLASFPAFSAGLRCDWLIGLHDQGYGRIWKSREPRQPSCSFHLSPTPLSSLGRGFSARNAEDAEEVHGWQNILVGFVIDMETSSW